MNRVLSAVAVAIFSVCVVSWQLQAGVVNITQGSTSGYTMTDGNTYVIQNSVSFSNSTAGGSGMSVADNATVVLYVPAGVTLTAKGANGSGRTGGGAGICVPQTATLIITGEGTVNAAGGKAGNGGNGAKGGNGSTIHCGYGYYPEYEGATYKPYGAAGKGSSGIGGTGGNGGGGAGAAIGGNGATGGSGGNGASAWAVSSDVNAWRGFCGNGKPGTSGGSGSTGNGMGMLYLIGCPNIVVASGTAGTAGNAGEFGDWVCYFYDRSSGADYYFATCGGGGGGGGGAGKSPSCSIGGGGSSGGGGGGGGSGAISARDDKYYDNYSLTNAHGGGGSGGVSNVALGKTGAAKEKTCGGLYDTDRKYFPKYYYGGGGGAGGAAGAEGGAGTLYVSPTATVNVNRTKLSATTHSSAQYTIIFNANGGQFSSAVESLTATLGCDLPNCIPAPTRRGYLFDGWRTAAGEEYYGTSGAKSKSSYPVVGNVTLYAQWQVDETYVDHTVTTPEEVPYSYFDNDYPTLLAEYGGDYEAAANATAANGLNKVWECFVSGTNPTNETSRFKAKIEMVGGMPSVTWDPNLNTNGVIRTYKVYGKETLEAGGEWQYPTNSLHRFFKVEVGLP